MIHKANKLIYDYQGFRLFTKNKCLGFTTMCGLMSIYSITAYFLLFVSCLWVKYVQTPQPLLVAKFPRDIQRLCRSTLQVPPCSRPQPLLSSYSFLRQLVNHKHFYSLYPLKYRHVFFILSTLTYIYVLSSEIYFFKNCNAFIRGFSSSHITYQSSLRGMRYNEEQSLIHSVLI